MESVGRIWYLIFFCFYPLIAWSHEQELIVYVSSQGMEYETGELFFESLLKQGSSPRVGHAWVALCRKSENGIVDRIEGGHSGEFGIIAPQYLERLIKASMNTEILNPIQVLYEPLEDGIFEKGSGGYTYTYAASFSLTDDGYDKIHCLLEEGSQEYPFHRWSLTHYNCVRFVLTCLGRIGIVLDAATEMAISPTTTIRGKSVHMWTDSRFSSIVVETPEKLESELKRMVSLGIAQKLSI